MSKLAVAMYVFDWGMEKIPEDIAKLAESAPKRVVRSSNPAPEPGEPDFYEREEPDCPELDSWAIERNAAFARGEL